MMWEQRVSASACLALLRRSISAGVHDSRSRSGVFVDPEGVGGGGLLRKGRGRASRGSRALARVPRRTVLSAARTADGAAGGRASGRAGGPAGWLARWGAGVRALRVPRRALRRPYVTGVRRRHHDTDISSSAAAASAAAASAIRMSLPRE